MKKPLLAAALALIFSPLTALADGVVSYDWAPDENGILNIPAGAKTGVVGLALGRTRQTVLKSDGSVIAWGDSNTGLLSLPTDLGPVKSIACGVSLTAAILIDGSVRVWSSDGHDAWNTPQAAKTGVVSISVGNNHILALKSDGSIVAWGDNTYGQISVPSDALQNVKIVCTGGNYSLALRTDGRVIAWGEASLVNIPAAAQTGVTTIAAGSGIAYAVKQDNTIVIWGSSADYYSNILESIQGSIKFVLADSITSGDGAIYVTNNNSMISGDGSPTPSGSYSDYYKLIKAGFSSGTVSIITKTNFPSYGDLEYQKSASAVTIVGYHGKGGDVTIPSTIEGLPVTAIADYAFASFHYITGIHFPDTLESIGSQAFDDCIGLEELSIPDSVVTMGTNAFSGCDNLVSVRLPLHFTGDIAALGFTGSGAASALLGGVSAYLPTDQDFANWVSSVTKQEMLTAGVVTQSALSTILGGYATLDQISTLATKTELETLRSTVTTLQTDLSSATSKLTVTESKLTTTSSTLTATQEDLSQTKTTLTSTQQELTETKAALSATSQDLSDTREDLQKVIAGLAKDPEFLRTLAEQITAGTNNYGMVVKQNQTLNFPAIPAVTYAANKTVKLTATSSAGLTPITFSSSDPAVASIIGNVVTLNKAGSIEITATQPGTNLVSPATASQTLTVNRIAQTLKLTSIPAQSYVAGKQIALKATSSAKLTPILFSSSDPAVASIEGSTLTLKGTGTTIITATQAGNDSYSDASASFTLTLK